MKVTCLPEKLNEGLATVGRVVSAKSPLPVLGNVLLQTDGGQLKLAATNLELTVICWVGAKVEEEGAITLPARLLADYVGLLSAGEPLELELKGKRAHLRCGRFEANISGVDAEEFPAIPSIDGGTTPRIAPTFKEAIRQAVREDAGGEHANGEQVTGEDPGQHRGRGEDRPDDADAIGRTAEQHGRRRDGAGRDRAAVEPDRDPHGPEQRDGAAGQPDWGRGEHDAGQQEEQPHDQFGRV
jgi:hypothetical protein